MAFTAVTSDVSGLQNTLKIVYDKKAIRNLLGINSPVLRIMKKDRVQGKAWNWPVLYSQSPAVAGDFTVAQSMISSMAAYEVSVTPGMLWAPYNTTAAEILAGATTVGAYPPTPPALVTRHFAATEGFRKTLGAAVYGSGFGEVGQCISAVTSGATTMAIWNNTRAAIGINTQFDITGTTTGLPSDALNSAGPFTVTSIAQSTSTAGQSIVTFSPAAPAGGFAQYAWICIHGCRVSAASTAGSQYLPLGLGAWVPSYGNRTTAGFTTYIGTSFFGLTRNTDIPRLAGSLYVAQQSSEKRIDGILEALRMVRDQGAEADIAILNSLTFRKVMQEIPPSYFQHTNQSGMSDKDNATRGFEGIKVNYLDSQVTLIADPFCPVDTGYVMNRDIFSIKSYTNVDTPLKEPGVVDDGEGVQGVEDTDIPPQDYRFLTNDYLTLQQGTASAYGPTLQIVLQFVGNFVVDNPAHAVVITGLT
jgi:hypothetical protein